MSNFMERYKACKAAIFEMSSQTSNKIWIGIASVGLAILVMLGPIVLLANCFIFNDYMNLVLIGLVLCFYFIIYLSRVFYYKTITKKQVADMKIFYLVDSLICLIGLVVGVGIGIFI
ncbi:MAG: hypothetical protein K2N65_03665 [Anaeroplasmataceae bacterium]|nr:hypothetical protein [Anaeroplasmataceae bacterium]